MKRFTTGATAATMAIMWFVGSAHAHEFVFNSPEALQEARRLDQLPPVLPPRAVVVDHSGRKQRGVASFYGARSAGRRMADGRPFNPHSLAAASKSLPLGTIATVTNLENGRSIRVSVVDRGPYIDGRVVDLTPQAAAQIGITEKKGIAQVEVSPIAVPQPDGSMKAGAGAAELLASAADEP
jgi:rare lipoprotein A